MKICAFIGDMYRDYSAAIIIELKKKAWERGHSLDIFGNCSVPTENPLHVEGLKSILNIPPLKDYDGIILCADTLNHFGMNKELIDRLSTADDLPPIISLRSDEAGFYNIVPDNRQIMHDITALVLSKVEGDDIGFVTGRDDLLDSAERRAGFEDAMKEADRKVREDLIFHGNYWIDQGPQQADFFIRPDGTLPKAIICSNDYMAIALMDELILRGYSIPKDTMITGVDNMESSAVHIPSLTTSEISETTLADSAIDSLEKILSGKDVDFYINVPGTLIERESTGKSDEGNDIQEAFRQLEIIKKTNLDKSREFVLISMDYEDALSVDKCFEITLNYLKSLEVFRSCYLCRHRENDRELGGYYLDNKDPKVDSIPFPSNRLLPEGFGGKAGDSSVTIYLPIHYRNEVYGYCVCEFDPKADEFIDEKIELVMVIFGQALNRIAMYNKLFEVEDIMDLYVKDALTGLYNRRGFDQKISALFDSSSKNKYGIAVASIDMDGLKYINDTFGHSEGDKAITGIAECIKKALDPNEFVARMGGDEFEAVLVIDNPGRVGQFIRTLRTEIKNANEVLDAEYVLSASIGTCEVSEWSMLMECMNKADKAMYLEKKTKKAGRGEAPR